jgi:hypothetical protein
MTHAKGRTKQDRARDMAEEALNRAAVGQLDEGKKLVRQARQLDAEAVKEVAAEVKAEERAASAKKD